MLSKEPRLVVSKCVAPVLRQGLVRFTADEYVRAETDFHMRQLIPTPNLYINSDQNPFLDVPPAFRNNEVNVLYVTDRQPVEQKDGTLRYGYERSASMAFGSAVVQIGEGVDWEQLVAASRARKRKVALRVSVSHVEEMGRFPATPFPFDLDRDEPGKKVYHDPKVVAEHEQVAESLREELRSRLALTPKKEAFVFIHGYNNDFDRAVSIIGQLWHFLPRQGIPIAYTWPAGVGGLRGYFYDRESGEFTIYHLKQFLRILSSCEELEKVHLLAHSRGTDVLTTALRELLIELGGSDFEPGNNRKLGNVIVAAPDLDVSVISQRIAAEEVGAKIDRLTVYMSKSDAAIGLSTWLFVSQKRVGRVTLAEAGERLLERAKSEHAKRQALIDSRVDSGFIGHSYFYSHPAVLSDLILILRDGRDPGEENGRPLVKLAGQFWAIEEDYML